MAGKRKQNDLRGVDRDSLGYWEEVLGRKNLSMTKGTTTHLVYVGTVAVLERIAGEREAGNIPGIKFGE